MLIAVEGLSSEHDTESSFANSNLESMQAGSMS